MISSYFATLFGGFITFILVILSAFIGIVLLRNFKYSLSANIKDLTSGNISQEDFVKTNMAKALGAVLLIVPGYFTDILGLLLQFGILTMIFSKIFQLKTTTYTNATYKEKNFNNTNYDRLEDSDIIDVEVIEKNTKKR